jgi:hypothetical protein
MACLLVSRSHQFPSGIRVFRPASEEHRNTLIANRFVLEALGAY